MIFKKFQPLFLQRFSIIRHQSNLIFYLALHMQEEINDPIQNIVQTVGPKIRTINLRQFQIMKMKILIADDDEEKDRCHVCGNCKSIFGDWRMTIIKKMWIIIETLVCWWCCNNNLLIICQQSSMCVHTVFMMKKKIKSRL